MTSLGYGEIHDEVLEAVTRRPPLVYFGLLALLAVLIGWAAFTWAWQIQVGMGAAGISHPTGWAFYITNFVFWVGIAHSGTLISAILYLVRAKWRTAISRSSEAMTIFAIMIAGLFPLIHLGRVWVFYFILPYPSQRQIWPNFISPLVWDVLAVSTYFIVSLIFFSVGLIPDLAAARDRVVGEHGPGHWRARLYRLLSLGWTGRSGEWHHYGRAYLYFAALATPLVISVHSIVSWDFAVSLLPGWHTTIFAPYFVAGAIHSGLAMVLVLLIPGRKLLRLERFITIDHFEAVAKLMIVTGAIIGYTYVLEPFFAWYAESPFEGQLMSFRAFGWLGWGYWALIPLNVLAPLLLVVKRIRRSIPWLVGIALCVVAGMWLERLVIIVTSLAHDFLPHNWGTYAPTWVEDSITLGSFAMFGFLFLSFTKLMPAVASNEVKELVAEEQLEEASEREEPEHSDRPVVLRGFASLPRRLTGAVGVFSRPEQLVAALRHVGRSRFDRVETFTPMRLDPALKLVHPKPSPVRFWTLMGTLSGLVGGFALAIGAATVNNLVVGGKPPVSLIPYCIPGFEGTILLGALANLAAFLFYGRVGNPQLPPGFDRRFTRDKLGLLVACPPGEVEAASSVLRAAGAEEVHAVL